MKHLKRCLSLPFLPVLLAPFVLLSPVLLAEKALYWGTPLLQFVPWWNWAWETLRAGHLPLWNPLVGMGAPLLANYQSALFYPPNWLTFILAALGGTPALAWGQAFLVGLHLAWAGIGMVLLSRMIGLGVLAQTLSGLAFGLSGYLVARSGFLSINAAAAWVPWVMLGGWQVARLERSNAPTWQLAIFLGLQLLAGHAQTAWYTLILAGLWTGFWGWSFAYRSFAYRYSSADPMSWKTRFIKGGGGLLQAWLRLGLALILAVGLAAVQLLPTAEYLLQSQRAAEVDYELAMTYSFWPWRLLGLLAPGLFGSPVQGDYWGYGNYWEDAIYLGLLPFLLAILALVSGRKRKPAREVEPERTQSSLIDAPLPSFLITLSLIAFILALGRNTPVFPWLYRHIPTFNMFQAPARLMIWLEFSVALLAGIGVEHWRRPEKRALYWTRLGTAGAFAVSLGAGLAWYLMGNVSPSFIRASALAGIWGLGVGALSLLAPPEERESPKRKANAWSWAVAVFVAADLLVAGWGLNPGASLDLYRYPSPTAERVQALASGGRLFLPDSDERKLKFTRFLRFDTFDPGEDRMNLRAVLLPNTNMLDGLPSVNNFDPLVPGRYARWMDYMAQMDPQSWGRLLDLMAVSVVEQVDVSETVGVRFTPVIAEEPENSSLVSKGRLRWVPCARVVQSEQEAWEQVLDRQIDLYQEVILEGVENELLAGCLPPVAGSRAVVKLTVNDNPNQVRLQVEAASPGWLVLSDTWYPGWQAWVDGEKVLIRRANYLFRAVQVPAGRSGVLLSYQPLSFRLGAAISLLVWAAIGWQMVRSAKQKISKRTNEEFNNL